MKPSIRWCVLPLLFISAMAAVHCADSGPYLPGTEPGKADASIGDEKLQLLNSVLRAGWRISEGKLRPDTLEDRTAGKTVPLGREAFSIVLSDVRTLRASELKIAEAPRTTKLSAVPNASRLAERMPGMQISIGLSEADGPLRANWRAVLRDGSNYIRQEVTLGSAEGDIPIREIVLLESEIAGAEPAGTVDGSPVTAGALFFGYEHPMSRNTAHPTVHCGFVRNAPLKPGEALTQSAVFGVTPPGQLRRGFLHYVERERAHPYRPYLHYNSWWDIAWGNRKFTEAESLGAINTFARELTAKRGVRLDGFVFDDGWDDNKTLWRFHTGFPNGFTPLKEAAAKLNAGVGVWFSPWGGYGAPKEERLRFGREQGFETNANGFSMAGPRYYERFREICLEMINKYGVNHFKFDGLAAGAAGGLMRDGDAMLRLLAELRAVKPDLYVNQTTGTWPSPFWLIHVDSTWRGGGDNGFRGAGSKRQQWITYRDMETYQRVVRRAPLYPINSLMTCGIIFAVNEQNLKSADERDFRDEVRSFFGSGTQLQELYVTPGLLSERHWDLLAEAAAWSRQHAGTLVDVHWVGGDPGAAQAYGWAAWSPAQAALRQLAPILVLRNPADAPREIAIDIGQAFELPEDAPHRYALKSPYKDQRISELTLDAGKPHTFTLEAFEVLVFDATAR